MRIGSMLWQGADAADPTDRGDRLLGVRPQAIGKGKTRRRAIRPDEPELGSSIVVRSRHIAESGRPQARFSALQALARMLDRAEGSARPPRTGLDPVREHLADHGPDFRLEGVDLIAQEAFQRREVGVESGMQGRGHDRTLSAGVFRRKRRLGRLRGRTWSP